MIRIKDIKKRRFIRRKSIRKSITKNRLQKEDVKKWYIYKKSIDARKKKKTFSIIIQ